MKGDFSRWDFDPERNDTGVLHQQGRVLLDRDWNAAAFIEGELRQRLGGDAIGEGVVAVPASGPDALRLLGAESDGKEVKVELNRGRCWVDGLHVRIAGTGPIELSADPYDPAYSAGTIAKHDRDAVVLELWEASVSAFQVPEELLEPALGGPDTTLRKRVCYALRLLRLGATEGCLDLAERLREIPEKKGLLTVAPAPTLAIDGDCPVQAAGGYTGFEHYLYRIEVARPAKSGAARFKWSRFNGGLVGRGKYDSVKKQLTIRGNAQAIGACGLNEFYLEAYDSDRPGCAPAVFAASAIQVESGTLKLTPEFGSWPSGPTAFFRLWDGIRRVDDFLAAGGTELEDGIQLAFSTAAPEQYVQGDYWDFPVRAGGIQNDFGSWPNAAPPEGVVYHRAPLGIVEWKKSAAGAQAKTLTDCRQVFRPLVHQEDCCTFTVGDGRSSHGDFQTIAGALAHLPAEGGKICVLPGLHTANVTIEIDGVTIQGCGDRSRVVSAPAADGKSLPVIHVAGAARCRIERLAIEAAPTSSGVLVSSVATAATSTRRVPRIPKNVVCSLLSVTAAEDSAIKVLGCERARITDCRITMQDVSGDWPGLFVRALGAHIEHNVVRVSRSDAARQPGGPELVGRGGIQIGGTSRDVNIVDNRIEGGIGNGITLGSVYTTGTDGLTKIEYGWVVSKGDACDPCAPGGTVIGPVDDGDGGQTIYRPLGPLRNVLIERNEILRMGLNGIGVVGFFDLDQQDEWVSVVMCRILGNTIMRCLWRPLVPLEGEEKEYAGYGGIALADVDLLVVHDNLIAGNGPDHREPVCGLFVLHGEGIDIHRNRILENGLDRGGGLEGVKPGARGGIHIAYAVAPTATTTVGEQSLPRQIGVPAACIHDNVVTQPVGHALYMQAVGPVSVQGNQLTTRQGGAELGRLHEVAATVLIADWGLSNEFYRQQIQFRGLATTTRNEAQLKATPTGFVQKGIDDYGPGKFLANGNVLFTGNQVVTDFLALGSTRALSAIAILSLDDVAFHSNQSDCNMGLREDLVIMNAFIFGASTRTSDNRFKESALGALLSGVIYGYMNHTTNNQATHCLVALGHWTVITGNLVVLDELAKENPDTPQGICGGIAGHLQAEVIY